MTSSDSAPSAERILLLSGLCCVFLAMALGVLFAFVISHVANAGIKDAWVAILGAVSSGDTATVRLNFNSIAELATMRGRIMNSHSHLGASGLLSLLLAVLMPLTALSVNIKLLLAFTVLGGVILQFGGVLAAWYFKFEFIYVADLGAIFLFICVAWTLYGLISPGNKTSELINYLQPQMASRSSRLLLKSGMVLLFVCMMLGMYLAWLIVSGGEAQSLAAVGQAVEHLMAHDIEQARKEIGNFKFTQAKSAINAASHSHGLVMAIFMLLLAILRPRINLADKSFYIGSIALVVLSFALPLWIFLAINVWFNFRFFANYSGVLLAMVTLFFIYGAIRSRNEDEKTMEG